jgi:hypothetical protein
MNKDKRVVTAGRKVESDDTSAAVIRIKSPEVVNRHRSRA